MLQYIFQESTFCEVTRPPHSKRVEGGNGEGNGIGSGGGNEGGSGGDIGGGSGGESRGKSGRGSGGGSERGSEGESGRRSEGGSGGGSEEGSGGGSGGWNERVNKSLTICQWTFSESRKNPFSLKLPEGEVV